MRNKDEVMKEAAAEMRRCREEDRRNPFKSCGKYREIFGEDAGWYLGFYGNFMNWIPGSQGGNESRTFEQRSQLGWLDKKLGKTDPISHKSDFYKSKTYREIDADVKKAVEETVGLNETRALMGYDATPPQYRLRIVYTFTAPAFFRLLEMGYKIHDLT